MNTPSLKVVVAITSPIAFHALSNQSILRASLETSQAFISQYGSNAHLAIACSEENLRHVVDFDCEKIQCNPNVAQEFAGSLQVSNSFDLVMVHDSQRALTKTTQFDRVFQALAPEIDAIRPVSAFTETLKSMSADQYIAGTIDRNSMQRISTPELIRYSAIDFNASQSSWFVPITSGARTTTVSADPESARINSEKEIELMKYLLDWNQ